MSDWFAVALAFVWMALAVLFQLQDESILAAIYTVGSALLFQTQTIIRMMRRRMP